MYVRSWDRITILPLSLNHFLSLLSLAIPEMLSTKIGKVVAKVPSSRKRCLKACHYTNHQFFHLHLDNNISTTFQQPSAHISTRIQQLPQPRIRDNMAKKQKKYEKLPVFYTSADSPSATATTVSTNHATSSNATASSSNQGTPIFFWKDDADNGYLCQWYKCSFTDPENPTIGPFNCAEQFMMYYKAMLFGDDQMADQIMKATSPRKQKGFGAQVQGFDEAKWNAARSEIVEKGNILKFSQ